jgi:hypothetical protein
LVTTLLDEILVISTSWLPFKLSLLTNLLIHGSTILEEKSVLAYVDGKEKSQRIMGRHANALKRWPGARDYHWQTRH